MNDIIKAGADHHVGDGGYSEGTQEKYNEFVKGRNQSLGKARIQQLALEAFQPINDITTEGVADRRTFDQAWFQHYNEKFAQLIVAECIKLCEHNSNDDEYDQYDMGQSVKAEGIKALIMKEFGVEE